MRRDSHDADQFMKMSSDEDAGPPSDAGVVGNRRVQLLLARIKRRESGRWGGRISPGELTEDVLRRCSKDRASSPIIYAPWKPGIVILGRRHYT